MRRIYIIKSGYNYKIVSDRGILLTEFRETRNAYVSEFVNIYINGLDDFFVLIYKEEPCQLKPWLKN